MNETLKYMKYMMAVGALAAMTGGVTYTAQAVDVGALMQPGPVMMEASGVRVRESAGTGAATMPMNTSMPNPADMVGMPSPMHDFSTVNEAAQYMGIDPQLPKVLPVGYNIESVTTINKDILQITYAYQPGEDLTRNQANGTRINYRVANGKDDISGDYNHYDVVKTESVDGTKVTFKGGKYMVRLATWVKEGQTHAMAFERPVTRDMAKAIIANVQVTKTHKDGK